MRVFLYDVSMSALSEQQRYDRRVCLHTVDTEGKNKTIILSNVNTFPIFLSFKIDEIFDKTMKDYDNTKLAKAITQILNNDNKNIFSTTFECEVVNMTPLVGFTNNRQDRVLRVYFDKISSKHKAVEYIDHHLKDVLTLRQIHHKVNDVNIFLHLTGLRLCNWIDVADAKHEKPGTYSVSQMAHLRDVKDDLPPPPLRCMTIRCYAHSSTSTRFADYAPSYKIDKDYIRCIVVSDGKGNTTSFTCDSYDDEAKTIKKFLQHVEAVDPHVLQQHTDLHNDLEYLVERMIHHDINNDNHLSRFPYESPRCVRFVPENSTKEVLFNIEHTGRMRLDCFTVLQKFYVSPPMDGQRLADCLDHPKILKNKEPYKHVDFDRGVSSKDSLPKVVEHCTIEVKLIDDIINFNLFLTNHMSLVTNTDTPLYRICEGGQQVRVKNVFHRFYFAENIYVNHWMFHKNFVVLRRKRQDTDLVDPEWLENPDISTINPRKKKTTIDTVKPKNNNKRKLVTVASLLGVTSAQDIKKQKKEEKLAKDKLKKDKNKRFGGGFVVPPVPGMYVDPTETIATLDFGSLYPSIIESDRICYMSVCYDEKWLNDTRATKRTIPLDDDTCSVFITHYDGVPIRTITDRIISVIVQNRKRVRKQMKGVTDKSTLDVLNATQLSMKVLQNGSYGFLGSSTSGMLCIALSAAVTAIGAWMNKTARHYVIKEHNAFVVYGDTDSIMIMVPVDNDKFKTVDEIHAEQYRKFNLIADYLTTNVFKPPNVFEFECTKFYFLMTSKKKTYGAIEKPPTDKGWNDSGHFLSKGFSYKKRDRCAKTQVAGDTLLRSILKPDASLPSIIQKGIEIVDNYFELQPCSSALDDFIVSTNLAHVYKSDENVIALNLAKLYADVDGVAPKPGRRLRYVVIHDEAKHKVCDRAIPPSMFTSKHKLDHVFYYNMLMKSMKQLLEHHMEVYNAMLERSEYHQKRLINQLKGNVEITRLLKRIK